MEGRAVSADWVVTGFDRDASNTIGGIVKRVVHSQLSVILPDMARALAAHGAFRAGRTSGQIWRHFDLPCIKGGPMWLGNRLAEMGAAIDGGAHGEFGTTTARVFDFDKAIACMKNGLLDRAKRYIERRQGQKTLFKVV